MSETQSTEEEEQFDTEDVAQGVVNTLKQMRDDDDSSVRVAGNRVSMTQQEFVEGVTAMVETLHGEYSDN